MNKLLLTTVLTLTLSTLPVTVQANLQNAEIYHCEAVADYSRTMFISRHFDKRVPYAEMIEPVKDDYVAVWAVGQALKQPLARTESSRNNLANRFGNKILLGCLDHKEQRGLINL